MENLMSDLKSVGETYLRKIYTQEHTFKKFVGCLRYIDKIWEESGYWSFDYS